MKKKFAALSAGLLSIICLAGCAKECELSELTAQCAEYDADEVRANYSACTIKTEIYYDSDIGMINTMLGLSNYGAEPGEKYTREDDGIIAVATAADLTGIADYIDVDSDSIHYYLDGTAIKVTVDYEGEVEVSGYTGTGSISYEFTTYSDGRYKKVSYSYEFDVDDSHTEYSSVETYSYTKA